MKKYFIVAAGLIAGATLMLAAVPGVAASIDINVGIPGVYVQPQPVYVQPRPVYIQPQYEHDWRERQVRATEWRNHGQQVSAEARERNDDRKYKHGKRGGKGKHGD